MRTLAFGTLFLLLSTPVIRTGVQESTVPDAAYRALVSELGECAAIHDGPRRLEAYDALATKHGVAPRPVEGRGKWSVKTTVSPIDDARSVVLSLEAEPESTVRLKGGALPQLVLRCKSGAIDAYVITGTPAEKEGKEKRPIVTLRFDKEKAVDLSMDASTDGEALFWTDPKPSIESMLRAERLLFLFTPAGSSNALIQFDLRGFAAVHPELAEACHAAK
jgi:hypothetical protein